MASWLAALYTSDSTLVRCEIDRVRDALRLDHDYAGIGGWHDGMVIQRRYAAGAARAELWEIPDTDVVVLASGTLPLGTPVEENAQPFRYHQWLFGQVAQIPNQDAVRERLLEQLPDFIQSMVRGVTLAEVIFAQFLAALRRLGRMDDPSLDAVVAGRTLAAVTRSVQQVSAEVGGTEKIKLGLVASNGRALVGARRGLPLSYSLLEGQVECRRCGLRADTPETEALVRDHPRRRSVVISTVPLRPQEELAVPEDGFVAVDRRLSVVTG
jgi:hypothetical protein